MKDFRSNAASRDFSVKLVEHDWNRPCTERRCRSWSVADTVRGNSIQLHSSVMQELVAEYATFFAGHCVSFLL